MAGPIVCTPKSLPATRIAAATRRAIEINPANALEHRTVARTPIGGRPARPPVELEALKSADGTVTGLDEAAAAGEYVR